MDILFVGKNIYELGGLWPYPVMSGSILATGLFVVGAIFAGLKD